MAMIGPLFIFSFQRGSE